MQKFSSEVEAADALSDYYKKLKTEIGKVVIGQDDEGVPARLVPPDHVGDGRRAVTRRVRVHVRRPLEPDLACARERAAARLLFGQVSAAKRSSDVAAGRL